jgi:hypothetical protein
VSVTLLPAGSREATLDRAQAVIAARQAAIRDAYVCQFRSHPLFAQFLDASTRLASLRDRLQALMAEHADAMTTAARDHADIAAEQDVSGITDALVEKSIRVDKRLSLARQAVDDAAQLVTHADAAAATLRERMMADLRRGSDKEIKLEMVTGADRHLRQLFLQLVADQQETLTAIADELALSTLLERASGELFAMGAIASQAFDAATAPGTSEVAA